MSTNKKIFFIFFVLFPLMGIAALTVYFEGFKKYGTPSEFRKKQEELIRAQIDSLRMVGGVLSPENIGDSTMVGMLDHKSILEDTRKQENTLNNVQSTLDSIKYEKMLLEELEKSIISKEAVINREMYSALAENFKNLGKLYDDMKPDKSVLLLIATDDTTAFRIIINMQSKKASKLMSTLAEKDIEKATRINKLLALIGKMR